MDFGAFSGGSASSDLQSCSCCGRTFNPETLLRHEKICRKVEAKAKSRKVFNSGKQRTIGSDVPANKVIKTQPVVKTNPVKITNWREKHLDFINSIRSARQADRALKTGGPLPPPPPPSINPDYIQCPHCNRRFNQKAGERHIPFCATRSKTFGAPVKPLNKTAVADVGHSSTGLRKSYDSNVVRRKQITGNIHSDLNFSPMQERSQTNIGFNYNTFSSKPTSNYTSGNSQQFGQRTTRAKSAKINQRVRFADNAGAGNNNKNGFKTQVHNQGYPSHGPPTYTSVASGNNGRKYVSEKSAVTGSGDVSRYGSQGTYRTTKASQLRSMSRNEPNALSDIMDDQHPTQETTTTLNLNTMRNSTTRSQSGRSPRNIPSPSLHPHTSTCNGLSPRPPSSPREQQQTRQESKSYSRPSVMSSVDDSTGSPSPFCYNCGTMYPLADARFCCGCGHKRAYLTHSQ